METLMALVHKLTRFMAPWLEGGEEVLHAIPVFHVGGARTTAAAVMRTGSGAVFSVSAVRAGAGGAASLGPHGAMKVVELPRRCVVAMTDRRILMFQRRRWTRRPVRLVAEYPLEQLVWVGAPVAKPGVAVTSERVAVGVPGPEALAWEFSRVYVATGRALMADLTRVVGTGG
jgi:hypothetical protein